MKEGVNSQEKVHGPLRQCSIPGSSLGLEIFWRSVLVGYGTGREACDMAHCVRFTIAEALALNHLGSRPNGEQGKGRESSHCAGASKSPVESIAGNRKGLGETSSMQYTLRRCNNHSQYLFNPYSSPYVNGICSRKISEGFRKG